jgi:capsular polysaccharide transport system permease protein
MGVIDKIDSKAAKAVPTSAERREAARAFSQRVSAELRRASREARIGRDTTGGVARAIGSVVPSLSLRAPARPLLAGFVAFVVIPSALVGGYYGLVASDVYEAEARFAVRMGAISGVDAFTSFAGLPSVNQVQDSLIVADFVESRAAVEALDREIGLRARFASEDIDPLSRLDADAPIEDVVAFWEDHVSVSIDSTSGIITVRVSAYTPDDAQEIAGALVRESEGLVNGIGARAREDLIVASERELEAVEARLGALRERLNALRAEQGIIDPQLSAQGLTALVTELRGEALKLDREIATTQRTVSADAPQIDILRARLSAVEDQILDLEGELTTRRSGGRDSISGAMTRFDRLALERQFLEHQYTTAAASLEQARAAAARQQMYLATFVRPVRPDEPSGPPRLLYSSLFALVLSLVWLSVVSAGRRLRAHLG